MTNPPTPNPFEPPSFGSSSTPPMPPQHTPEPPARGGRARTVWGWILIVLGVLIILSTVARFGTGAGSISGDSAEQIGYAIGAIGLPLVLLIIGIRLVRKRS